jgi:hypothetical protein
MVEPNLANDRVEMLLPKLKVSNTLKRPPKYDLKPVAEKLLPSLVNCLTDKLDPKSTKSSTDILDPRRPNDRKERVEPIVTELSTDNLSVDPKAQRPISDKPLEQRVNARIDIDEPIVTKSKTLQALPNLANDRTLMEEAR